MGYVIDTSAIIELERGKVDWSELSRTSGDEPAYLPAIVWAELMAGVHLADTVSRAMARRTKLERLRQGVVILEFTSGIAETWAEMFAEFRKAGNPIPSNGLQVAATARFHHHKVLVGKRNENHFRRIRALQVVCLRQ